MRIGSFFQKLRYFTYQNGPKAHGNEFLSIFKFRNECHKQLEWKKVSGKNGVISLVFKFPPRVIVLKLSKKGNLFLQFCAYLSNKSKYIKTIYIKASEKSCCALSENGIIILRFTVSEILGFEVKELCLVSAE